MKLSSFCQECKATCTAKYDKIGPDGTTVEHKAGEFIKVCKGIPENYLDPEDHPEYYRFFNEEERSEIAAIHDPVAWAAKYLDWHPRKAGPAYDNVDYQANMLQCSSKRKVARIGRRSGKSETVAVGILHYIFTTSRNDLKRDLTTGETKEGGGRVLVVTPFKSQIEELFSKMRRLIQRNPILQNEVLRDVNSPNARLELKNGSYVVGFTAGTKSGGAANQIRGQGADLIVLDEADYLSESDLESILAILIDNPDVKLWASSTPQGRKSYFYDWCHDPSFKEFHYPSMVNPNWNDEMDKTMRNLYRGPAYRHEVMAEFGEQQAGVFLSRHVEEATIDYQYDNNATDSYCGRNGWKYTIGVDWNDKLIGTEIVVTGLYQAQSGTIKYRVVEVCNIGRENWTQLLAVQKVISLNRKWKPEWIYVDAGFGATQIQLMERFSLDSFSDSAKGPFHPDSLLKSRLKAINFSSKLELKDPNGHGTIQKEAKPFLVENALRYFEDGVIEINANDTLLLKQLADYAVLRQTPTGYPVYGSVTKSIGDHRLDALMLSLAAFSIEMTAFSTVRNTVSRIAILETNPILERQFGNHPASESPVFGVHDKVPVARKKSIPTQARSLEVSTKSYYGDIKVPANYTKGLDNGIKIIYNESDSESKSIGPRRSVRRGPLPRRSNV